MMMSITFSCAFSTQLNSSLLTHGSRMAKRNTVHKNKSKMI